MQKLGKNQMAWIKELESGKHRQTQGYLHVKDKHRHNKFCCLGVFACKVMNQTPIWQEFTPTDAIISEAATFVQKALYNGKPGTLSLELTTELGLHLGTGEASHQSFCQMSENRKNALVKWANENIYSKIDLSVATIDSSNIAALDLVSQNDDYDRTFKQIAYALKTWPEIWFKEPA